MKINLYEHICNKVDRNTQQERDSRKMEISIAIYNTHPPDPCDPPLLIRHLQKATL